MLHRLIPVVLTAVALVGLTACSRAPQTPHYTVVDWYKLDRELDKPLVPVRRGWLGHWFTMNEGWAGPAETFLPTIAFDAAWDSLGEASFLELSAPERAWRQQEAHKLVQLAFLAVADRVYRIRAGVREDDNYARAMTRVLRRLRTAVGTDPTSSEAWFHLAIFSNVVGDRQSASRARHRYLDLTGRIATGELTFAQAGRRCRLILDEAWDLRDAGLYEECLSWLGDHAPLLRAGSAGETSLPPATEADLICALCYAERGDLVRARAYLSRLPRISLNTMSVDSRAAYWRLTTDDLRLWVHAWLDLRRGFPDLVAWKIGYRIDGVRSLDLMWRFWQDLGQIAAELGDWEIARHYWTVSYWDRPFKSLFPQTAHRPGGMKHPVEDAGLPFYQGYRAFFLGGSLWGYALSRTLASQYAEPTERPLLWRQATSSLDACIRRGFQPRAARLLRARLHILREDWAAAEDDLQAVDLTACTTDFTKADHSFLQGVTALTAGNLANAMDLLERSVKLYAEHAEAWQALAVTLAYQGRKEEALAAFAQIEQLQPFNGPNYYNRGLLHLQRDDRPAALADLERAAALMPGDERVTTLLLAVADGAGIIVDLSPQPVRLLAIPGVHEAADDQYVDLSSSGAEEPPPSDLALVLAADRERGDPTLALAIAAGAVPDDDLAADNLLIAVLILLEHDRTDEARAILVRARALAPDQSAILKRMAELLE